MSSPVGSWKSVVVRVVFTPYKLANVATWGFVLFCFADLPDLHTTGSGSSDQLVEGELMFWGGMTILEWNICVVYWGVVYCVLG